MINREKARKKAEDLVSQMTIEERASQLRYDAPAIERLGIPAYNWWGEALHALSRHACHKRTCHYLIQKNIIQTYTN